MESTGTILAAESENESRLNQLESYKQLREQGNASPREYERAVSEQAKAAARLQAAKEDQQLRRLEYERVQAQIAQRQIKSPIRGHVVVIDKEAGEFVSPTDPVVMHIVQIDTLKAVFSVPRSAAVDIAVGQSVDLSVGYEAIKAVGTVDFVSPIADPQSGTVRVKIRIANTDRKLQSGSSCRWNLANYESTDRITNSTAASKR
jgi:RND family efflux transporter MFP subunit